MSEQENARIAHSSMDALNAHDGKKYVSLMADNFRQVYGPGTQGPLTGEQSWAYVQGFINAFPDLHFDVTRTVAQGDAVDVHWIATGTHICPLRTPTGNTIPPTGKRVTIPGLSSFEIQNGRIIRGLTYWDMVTLLGQLGLMPTM